MKEFTKDDLQVNDIVTARDGERYMIYKISRGLVGVSSNDCFYVGKGADFWHDDMMKVQRPVYLMGYSTCYLGTTRGAPLVGS